MGEQTSAVSFFAVSSGDGRELARRFKELARAEFGIDVLVRERATQQQFFRACLDDFAVVFDASAEAGETYAAATAQPMVLDNVLVVSRTYLPLNFYGLREGGAPEYPEPAFQSNDGILVWLRTQLADLLRVASGKPPRRGGLLNYFRSIRESLDVQERRWNSSGCVFISYRSRHLKEVERLAREVEAGRAAGGPPRTVRFLRPGQLVYEDELLTPLRHWQLASTIDRKIGASEEMWLFGTDDYLDSWWTRAELVTVAYRLAAGTKAPRVRLYDPAKGTLGDPPAGWLPRMSREQQRRMARWYANTDPGSMGPEALPVMRIMASIPLVNRIKYFSDPVWSKEFWQDPLLPCSNCRLDPRAKGVDLEAFLWLKESHLVRLAPVQLKEAVALGQLNCPRCGATYEISEAPHPRLLWMPVRYGKPTAPDGESLMPLPVFRVRAPSSARRGSGEKGRAPRKVPVMR